MGDDSEFYEQVQLRCDKFREAINEINLPYYLKYDRDLESICQNLFHRCNK